MPLFIGAAWLLESASCSSVELAAAASARRLAAVVHMHANEEQKVVAPGSTAQAETSISDLENNSASIDSSTQAPTTQ